jgi:hypothetical protein
MHLQTYDGQKYLYDFSSGEFEGLPNSIQREVLSNPSVARAISTGAHYLGLDS